MIVILDHNIPVNIFNNVIVEDVPTAKTNTETVQGQRLTSLCRLINDEAAFLVNGTEEKRRFSGAHFNRVKPLFASRVAISFRHIGRNIVRKSHVVVTEKGFSKTRIIRYDLVLVFNYQESPFRKLHLARSLKVLQTIRSACQQHSISMFSLSCTTST